MNSDTNRNENSFSQSGYAHFQMAKALVTVEDHTDSETRKRAIQKIEKWQKVIQGNLAGTIQTGSRTPVDGTPEWVTLEVITGGFATGEFLAGGDLKPHEADLANEFDIAKDSRMRTNLNYFFLTEPGLDRLYQWLNTGLYHVETPEEGALLSVAWLTQNSHSDSARQILETITPWFNRLRFFPKPETNLSVSDQLVSLQTVNDSIQSLRKVEPNEQILAQQDALTVWNPFLDEVVDCFLEIIDGPPPQLGATNNIAEGGLISIEKATPQWCSQAQELAARFDQLKETNTLCRKPVQKKGNLYQLMSHLRGIVNKGTEWLTISQNRDRIRILLARIISKRGVPGCSAHQDLRSRQQQQSETPLFSELAKTLVKRLKPIKNKKDGLIDPDTYLAPVSAPERNDLLLPVPPSLRQKVEKSVLDTPQGLIERGFITSSEILASLSSKLIADVRASGIEDEQLRRLDQQIYCAFRRRRSLLLLNLESQVKVDELPWMEQFKRFRKGKNAKAQRAHQVLTDLALLAQTSFPEKIFPNKLISEFATLSKLANLSLPLVEELAVDIFMGAFSPKIIESARETGRHLENSLYARYYDIDCELLKSLNTSSKLKPKRFIRAPSSGSKRLLKVCENRAGVKFGGWDTVTSGRLLEQLQIVTTHNLALVNASILTPPDESMLRAMCEYTATWLYRRLQTKQSDRHSRLISLKQSAYAWRQMVYFMSSMTPSGQAAFGEWLMEFHESQPSEFKTRFAFAIERLLCSIDSQPSKEKPFYGWVAGGHPLL